VSNTGLKNSLKRDHGGEHTEAKEPIASPLAAVFGPYKHHFETIVLACEI
jgi:hypothetical protein